VAAIGFGIAAFTLGHGGGLGAAEPDSRATDLATDLPADRPLRPSQLAGLRFDLALRGYRMAQVDEVLRRLGTELQVRDAEIRRLRRELTGSAPGESAGSLVGVGLPAPEAAALDRSVEVPVERSVEASVDGSAEHADVIGDADVRERSSRAR
jgi:DivIVA domain-containing protein